VLLAAAVGVGCCASVLFDGLDLYYTAEGLRVAAGG